MIIVKTPRGTFETFKRDKAIREYVIRDLCGDYIGPFTFAEARGIMEQVDYNGYLMVRRSIANKEG